MGIDTDQNEITNNLEQKKFKCQIYCSKCDNDNSKIYKSSQLQNKNIYHVTGGIHVNCSVSCFTVTF